MGIKTAEYYSQGGEFIMSLCKQDKYFAFLIIHLCIGIDEKFVY